MGRGFCVFLEGFNLNHLTPAFSGPGPTGTTTGCIRIFLLRIALFATQRRNETVETDKRQRVQRWIDLGTERSGGSNGSV